MQLISLLQFSLVSKLINSDFFNLKIQFLKWDTQLTLFYVVVLRLVAQ